MSHFLFDQRTRTAESLRPTTTAAFHLEDFEAHMDDNGDLATQAFAGTGLAQFGICVDGQTFTWQLDAHGSLEVVEGDPGSGPLVIITGEWFDDLVNDIRSAVALMISEEFEMTRGTIVDVINWEPTLRALVDGRPSHSRGSIIFSDEVGRPLDLHRSFTLDDEPSELVHFLAQTGFAHLRGVFSPSEVSRLSDIIDLWRDRMNPEDERAWYAKRGDETICVRVTGLGEAEVDFPYVERLGPIAALVHPDYRFAGTDLLVKPVDISEGISDLPWHKDCALGMHSYSCTSLTFGVSVTGSDDSNGRLGVVAGSHRVNIPLFDVSEDLDLPQVFLDTSPGDVTIHTSCAMHCATPPTHSERRVTYSSFRHPGSAEDLAAKVRRVRDRAGRHTYAPT